MGLSPVVSGVITKLQTVIDFGETKGKMFECSSASMCARKFPLMLMSAKYGVSCVQIWEQGHHPC